MATNIMAHHHQWVLPCLSFLILFYTAATEAILSTNITVDLLDPTLPPLPQKQAPKCSIITLNQEFRGTTVRSVPANYAQPTECPPPWTLVVLELSMSAWNTHKNSIASVFINGGEVLRTATPIAPGATVASWKVHKDITRYSSLLRGRKHSNTNTSITMVMKGTKANPGGVFTANATVHFYRGGLWNPSDNRRLLGLGSSASPAVKGLYRHPANFIVPITTKLNEPWFRVEANSCTKSAVPPIPRNTYRAILEIFVSYHGPDELWYSNPLRSTYGSSDRLNASVANGGFRQVYAEIDGKFVGGHIPFPVIYPGSINSYFWSPVTAIGAFDMPSYNLELTPLLQLLLDGKPHEFSLGVKESRKFWLLSANLHLWVDHWSDDVQAGILDYRAPPLKLTRQAAWQNEDGTSEVDAEGLLRFVGWVSSSKGNLTVTVRQKVTFQSQVQVQNGGAVRQVDMVNKERLMVGVHRGSDVLGRVQVFTEAPLQVQSSSTPAAGGAAYEKSRLYHQWEEMVNVNDNANVATRILSDRQDAEGAALVHKGTAVWGSGSTQSVYKYRDDTACYLRSVNADMGMVKVDVASRSCAGGSVAEG